MIQILLTLFFISLTPGPWIVSIIHILVMKKLWNYITSKVLLINISLLIWALFGYWLFNNNELIFANKFDSIIAQVIGVIVLISATAIEFLTQMALGEKRINGKSEFKQNKDPLIISGIYKYARHPRYVEWPLWSFGLGLVFGYISFIWFFVYLFISFAITAYFEEQELIKRYGEQYLEYKKKTPAFFIGGKN